MKSEPLSTPPLTASLKPQKGSWFAGIAAAGAVAVGLLVIAGWAWSIEPLKRVLPGLVSMNPATAVLFCIAGVSLWLSSMRGLVRPHPIARPLAWLVAVAGAAKLAGLFLHWDQGIDQTLFSGSLGSDGPHPNRMAPNTAVAFILIGLALVNLDTTMAKGRRPAELLAALASLVSLVALIGYLYGVPPMFGVAAFMPMALHTAIVLQLLALGILFARSDRGAMAVATSGTSGGLIVRRLFPSILVAFVVLGGLRLAGERHGYYGPDLAVTLYTTATILIFGILIGWIAGKLHRSDLEQSRLEEALRLRSKELAVMNEELEAFSYSVSHDLRTPLRHIAGFTGLLARRIDASDATSQRHLATIKESIQRMNQLIEDLVAFARIGRAPLHPEAVDLKGLVAEVRDSLSPELQGRVVTWMMGDLPVVTGDRALLRQVFVNLMGNAIKYSRKKPEALVEIEAKQSSLETIVLIRDNGAGFDMRQANQLFGMFQRLHPESEFEGTGVGLANVRRIIQRLGGRTWAEGTPGFGATFYFSLPRT